MNRRVLLNGNDWQLKGFIGEDWMWHNVHKPGSPDVRWWHRGTVPGSVHNDLWRAGEIPDPYYERNSLLIEWVPERTWVYKKTFFVDRTEKGKRVHLHFKGVDYAARFFLNGQLLGSHQSMYTPAVFEVGDRLRYGEENLLAVVFDPAPHEQPQIGRTSQVRTHKSRMTYWWDFCLRWAPCAGWSSGSIPTAPGYRRRPPVRASATAWTPSRGTLSACTTSTAPGSTRA
ncbi:MAG: hypothetical protein M5U01_42275 [Ardenticatenaceae bacterium]|nr:hypothetical protein [Ardenticatenaceae bacterium]